MDKLTPKEFEDAMREIAERNYDVEVDGACAMGGPIDPQEI
jgi:hypothetical protein